MFLIAGDEDCGPASHFAPFTVLKYLTNSGVDKNFVFPFVGMSWSEATGLYSKNTHAEIVSLVFFSYNDPSRDTLYCVIVELVTRYFLVICYFHNIPVGLNLGAQRYNYTTVCRGRVQSVECFV